MSSIINMQSNLNTFGSTFTKHCNKCTLNITYKNWARHLMTNRHKVNDPESTILKKFERCGTRRTRPTAVFTKPRKINTLFPFHRSLFTEDDKTIIVKRTKKSPAVFSNPRKINKIFPFHESLIENKKVHGEKPFVFFPVIYNTDKKIKRCEKPFAFFPNTCEKIREPREKPFAFFPINVKRNEKFKTIQLSYRIDLKKITEVENALYLMLLSAMKTGEFMNGDKVNLLVEHSDLRHPISRVIPSKEKITKKHVAIFTNHIARILTSDEHINIGQAVFTVMINHVPRGGKGEKIINLTKDRHTKKSIVQIKNTDNLCGIRAIIVGLTYHMKCIFERELTVSNIKEIRMGRKIQDVLAIELCSRLSKETGKDVLELFKNNGVCYADIKDIEKLLDVQIIVIDGKKFNTVDYKGNEKAIKIYLYKNGDHYDTITKMAGFLSTSYYCENCNKPYEKKNRHICKDKDVCRICTNELHTLQSRNKVYCKDCNRYCYNENCFNNHAKVCSEIYKCTTCNRLVRRFEEHICGSEVCRNCNLYFEDIKKHKCYMMPKNQLGGIGTDSYTEKYIFFDYESNQETGIHIANLVVAQYYDGSKFIFKTNDEFCEWLISKEHKKYTAIAHYARGYDSHFILEYCVRNSIKPKTITNGTKLMSLEAGKVRIIDSSNFVAAPLSTFPKTFGLKELKKGYFPHYFNTVENQSYKGSIPDVKFYSPETMKPSAREEFLKWHAERVSENYYFDFAKELEEYCSSDVDILRRSCLIFREAFLEIADIDPFQYTTIAGTCMAIYRSSYLKNETLAIVKPVRKEMFSKESISWISKFPNVQHAMNGGEVEICGAKVDGFDKETNTVYQYHGCFWHGCPKCFHEDIINNVNQETMGDLYEKTLRRSSKIRDAGYNLVEMWGCQWKQPKFSNIEVDEPINPRDAFFGGRTDVTKLKVKNQKIGYIDVCSLYPTVQFYDKYPIGHPTVIIKPEIYDENWFGLIKCKVLPPRELYHPVLPVKLEKLLFVLCVKCFREKNNNCTHSDEERSITGTWTTVEINKALEKGYKILCINEVWHFENTSEDLFKGYVKKFMKIKLETSPWEADFESVEKYVESIMQSTGIELALDKIKPNPGYRSVSKICLNSLWGKFGQRQNMSQTEYITDVSRWFKILLDDTLEISSCIFITEDMVQVNYKYHDKYVEDPFSTNIYIATFTTAHARLRLYDMLDKIGNRVVYYDTDSVVHIIDEKNPVQTGCLLGEWTNELASDDYISEFFSTGPKSYAYKTNKGKEVLKVKGFTLNYENSTTLSRQNMEKILDKEINNITLSYNMITRDRKNKKLVNKHMDKQFKFDYDKRCILTNYDTKPWGY
uniref:DNA-directed DNA polymerase n=1 Tax=Cacopsylla melanoneura TaxID=428564 RepID=A0A8D8ZAP4_9HEMI